MKSQIDRRSFMRITGASLGMGTLYRVAPLFGAGAEQVLSRMEEENGERMAPFSFLQLSDAHVGFNGPPDPLGTKAFERAVEMVNDLPQKPDLVLFTGDLTQDSEDKDVHVKRMKLFRDIVSHMNAGKVLCVPGEHDAGLDGGALYRDVFGDTHYSFDHKGVHFIGLDNVSRARPEVGPDQLAWLKKDLARFPRTAPIVVFTHRPLFDLKPDWEWFTRDGDDVMAVLASYESVTVLYGHIHRDHEQQIGNTKHYAARSLIFAFPDPEKVPVKSPMQFDKDRPFKNLGIRAVNVNGFNSPAGSLEVHDIELTLREYSGRNGIQQILKHIDI